MVTFVRNKLSIEVYGIKCKIITAEDKSYMLGLAQQVESLAKGMETGSKNVALAVTALSFCHDVNVLQAQVDELKKKLELSEENLKEYQNRSEEKKYSSNPLRLNVDDNERLENFYEIKP